MKKLLACLALSGIMAPGVMAQELEHSKVQVSFLPGIGTNGTKSGAYYNTFSVNLLGGYNGGLQGVELGGILNSNKSFSKGLQMAGVANLTGGETSGLQMAGILNANKGRSEAVQLAGVANFSRGGNSASQWAGLVNMAGDSSSGAQFSGVANVMNGNIRGLQSAGVVNVAGEVKGSQLSGVVNQAKSVTGVQIGVLNIAGNSRGAQVGVINIADSASTTIGLINVVRKNGYYRGEVWAGETLFANAVFKMGTKNFYSLLAAGWRQNDSKYHLGYGYGFGSEFLTRERVALSLDLVAYHLSENELWTDEGVNNMYQARLTWARGITGKKAFLVGATFNVLRSEFSSAGADGAVGMAIAPWTVYDKVTLNRLVALWPGLNVGLKF